MEEINNWLEDMTFEFDNDFLGVNKSKINDLLSDIHIDKLKN